jgi:PEP-CTERM motif
MKKLLLAVLLMLTGLAANANAHSISIGFENAGPGAVTVWLGTYNHGGHHLEGNMQLDGVLGTVYGPNVQPFTLLTSTGEVFKPGGLIDGVTNFFVQGTGIGNNDPLVGTDASWLATFPGLTANHWQGATFAGLSPGDYQFNWIPIANPTAEWSPYSQSMNGIFHLSGTVINPNPIPEPTTMLLLGFGLISFAKISRRKN